MGQSGSTAASANGANGTLRVGSRVRTQWTREEGGDGNFYSGKVTHVFENDEVKIKYDDGDTWKGSAKFAWSMEPGTLQPREGGESQPASGQVVQGRLVSNNVVEGHLVGNNAADSNSHFPPLPPIGQPELASPGEQACPVCTTNRMNMAFGCGHRVCGGCVVSLRDRNQPCPVCRQCITQVIRLYN
eukprot:TRINITY_DN26576_c0_g2_i1.p1 TRINITY_DN26576_c0_g2~~TRINITY_DN26576_c0_g2_i1.p1  ORF type:complete len:187 (-),score=25.89 TRINITY_DN26576_c0_g2_i1:81-641(-)